MYQDVGYLRLRGFAQFALIAIFLLAGTLGHDPWKQDETYSFGIIYHFYTTHSWLIPMNAGMPFMEKPPLYYWTAILLCKLFSGALPLYDAARLTSTFYTAISCVSLWYASRILFREYTYGKTMAWVVLALFLGSFGLVRHVHDMFTDVALVAGMSLAFLGLALLANEQKKWLLGGIILGIGVGIAFLSKGFLVPVILGISCVALLVILPRFQSVNTIIALFIALLVASPFLVIWPLMLHAHDPQLFYEWFWENNVGRFMGSTVDRLGAGNKPFYMLYSVLWFALPAFPLACVTLAGKRGDWQRPEYGIPLVIAVTGLVFFLLSASARALYLLPLLPAFALLGAQALMDMPPRLIEVMSRLIRVLASIAALAIFVTWICLLHQYGPQPLRFMYGDFLQLGFVPDGIQWTAICGAVVTAGFWIASFRLAPQTPENVASLWLAAMTLLWGLTFTLLLPWIDETRSFRGVLTNLDRFVSQPAYADKCIARYNLGESVAPMWEYFGHGRGLGPMDNFGHGTSCPLLLTLTAKGVSPSTGLRWHLLWKGSRPMDGKDELQLYEIADR